MASEEFLARARGLNLTPERVLDARFLEEDGFFDPKDLVQVRYELLRLSQVEEVEVTEACRRFGFSRTTYYKVAEAFARGGVAGLVGQRRGRPGPIKMTSEVLGYVLSEKVLHPELLAREMVEQVKARYGKSVSVRMIQHVWQYGLSSKKTRPSGD